MTVVVGLGALLTASGACTRAGSPSAEETDAPGTEVYVEGAPTLIDNEGRPGPRRATGGAVYHYDASGQLVTIAHVEQVAPGTRRCRSKFGLHGETEDCVTPGPRP
ncbi:MAG: hypothetical protein V4617_15860 [Gemmatimonadota bacterium]